MTVKSMRHSLIEKRSVVIDGHKTSISLEEPFWAELKALAAKAGKNISDMVMHIDRKRTHTNLSSAIRLYILAHYTGE